MRSFAVVVPSALAMVTCLVPRHAPAASRVQQVPRPLPVRYLADRYAVAPITEQGDTLVLYTDTGGGTSRLWAETVIRLGLVAESVATGRETLSVARLPRFMTTATIPPPTELPPIGERLLVRSTRSWQGMSTAMDAPIQGALGGSALKYFRITVDYPNATALFERP